MNRSLGLPLFLATLLAACSSAPAPAPSPPSPPGPSPENDPGPPEPRPLASAAAPKPPPSLMFEGVQGANAARANAVFAPIRAQLAECSPQNRGSILVGIENRAGSTKMHVAPGSTVDPKRMRCALEVLSTVDPDAVLDRQSPIDRPSGFTGQIRIEW
ncbi:MAG: hypothetical protein U0359_35320 [Byssovorax sp.]